MFGVLVATWLVEMILSATWNKTYFTTGFPAFVTRIPVEFRHGNIPSARQLEARFYSTWTSSLVFNEIDLHTFAFREKFFEFRLFGYSSLMRGMLFFDYIHNQVTVKGFFDWTALCFSLMWLGGVVAFSRGSNTPMFALGFTLFFVLLTGLLYGIQYYRFSKVAAFAAATWSRK